MRRLGHGWVTKYHCFTCHKPFWRKSRLNGAISISENTSYYNNSWTSGMCNIDSQVFPTTLNIRSAFWQHCCWATSQISKQYEHLNNQSCQLKSMWDYMIKHDQILKGSTVLWFIDALTLNVLGPNYLGLTRSISWLLMPWLLASPGHQQPWYWLHRIIRSLSFLRKEFNYLCHVNMEQWHKI